MTVLRLLVRLVSQNKARLNHHILTNHYSPLHTHTYIYTLPRNSTRLDWSVRSPIYHWSSCTRFWVVMLARNAGNAELGVLSLSLCHAVDHSFLLEQSLTMSFGVIALQMGWQNHTT